MIRAARRAGVRSPHLYFVDAGSSTLVMEYVEGDRVKDLMTAISPEGVAGVFRQLGRDAAKLHHSGIMHGDLTTANVMLRGGGLVFLDFGLSLHSTRVEDHAVDLRLIKETLIGAHSDLAGVALKALLDGYEAEAGTARSKAVLAQLRNIERRGRYARVD
jgi:TP53 regulating kinase-like protein